VTRAETRRVERGPDAPVALHYGRFLTAKARHGGTRRSQQLREILERSGVHVVPVALESERRRSRVARAWGVARGVIVTPLEEMRHVRRLAGLYHRAMADKSLSRYPSGLVVLWEGGPGETFFGGWAAQRNGHPVVAAPQNFDSLTPGMASALTGRHSPDWFAEELNELRYADAVFVLSAHDRWLLSLHDIHAEILPYHPPADIEEHLLGLRRDRSLRTHAGTSILALGTLGSEPTARGFRDLLRMLEEGSDMQSFTTSIVIAGYGTEGLRTDFGRIGARVAGTVSEGELDELLLDARALLVHYVPAPGALTRIPEALIAGIPVVANRHAARGFESNPGVHVYDSRDELVELLAADLPTPPVVPTPMAAEGRFISRVLNADWDDAEPVIHSTGKGD
jgi:glycosyltransferase involved in cell wall biosynthesis